MRIDNGTMNFKRKIGFDAIVIVLIQGYGQERLKLFTFLCYHRPQHGHCVVVSMDNQKVVTMVHTDELDLVDEDDC